MPRIALLNIIIGFSLIILASAAGSFVALDTTYRFLNQEGQNNWRAVLEAASHGHTALFGVIHILIGLTLPYSKLPKKFLRIETMMLFCGALAMGPGMYIRGFLGPTSSTEWNGLLVGALLSAWLVGVVMHTTGLVFKYFEKN